MPSRRRPHAPVDPVPPKPISPVDPMPPAPPPLPPAPVDPPPPVPGTEGRTRKPKPVPASDTATADPVSVIVGGHSFADNYGFKADAGLHYYGFGVGHGTERDTQHTGIDAGVPYGTPLYAPVAGVVRCVGDAGTPDWGQSCGAYNDYGDAGGGTKLGIGNITIMLDGGVKLTLGHCRKALVKPGGRVTAGQQVGTSGGMNGGHCHVETSVQRNGTYWLLEPREALRPLMQPTPQPTPSPAPQPPPAPHPVTGAITKDTPFRQIGDVPAETWRRVLTEATSPLLMAVEDIVKAASPHGAMALAQAYKESSLGKTAPTGTYNPLGLLDYTPGAKVKYVNGLPFCVFASWPEAFREYNRRLSDLSYKAGVYAPASLVIEGYIVTYVGGPECWRSLGKTCANGETWVPGGSPSAGSINLYIDQALTRINSWRSLTPSPTPTPTPTPQPPPTPTPTPTPTPSRAKPIIYDIRATADAQRFGLDANEVQTLLGMCITNRNGLKPMAILWHIQDGVTVGSLDWWLHGYVGGVKVQASVTVMAQRDGSLLRVIPEQHGPWTNGDVQAPNAWGQRVARLGGGEPNPVTLSIEAEGHPFEPLTPAQENAILWQTETWMATYGISAEMVGPHAAINSVSRPNCPGAYYAKLHPQLTGGGSPVPPEPTYAPAYKLPHPWDGRDWKRSDGVLFRALSRTFAAAHDDVRCRQSASVKAPEVRAPLAKGNETRVEWLVESEGAMWAVSNYGSRVLASDLTPTVTIADATA